MPSKLSPLKSLPSMVVAVNCSWAGTLVSLSAGVAAADEVVSGLIVGSAEESGPHAVTTKMVAASTVRSLRINANLFDRRNAGKVTRIRTRQFTI